MKSALRFVLILFTSLSFNPCVHAQHKSIITELFKKHPPRNKYYTGYYYHSKLKKEEGLYQKRLREGEWKFYYENGVLAEKRFYKHDTLEGSWVTYTQRSRIFDSTYFIKGKKEGEYKLWWENGKLNTLMYFVNNFGEGIIQTFDSSGAKLSEGTLKKGLNNGLFRYYYPDGKIKEEKSYSNNYLNGTSKSFSQDGRLMLLQTFDNGLANGLCVIRQNNNAVDSLYYKNGMRDSVLLRYDPKGLLLSKLFYRNDSIVSTTLFQWYSPGKKKSEFNYDKELAPIGRQLEWYENGKLFKEYFYSENALEGTYTEYFENGNRKERNYYSSGILNGIHFEFFQDGKIHISGAYLNGEMNGRWTEWSLEGKLIAEKNYTHGELNGQCVDYFPTGKKKQAVTYVDGKKVGYVILYRTNGRVWKKIKVKGTAMPEENVTQTLPQDTITTITHSQILTSELFSEPEFEGGNAGIYDTIQYYLLTPASFEDSLPVKINLSLKIDEKGRITGYLVEENSNRFFAEAAITAARHLKCKKPAFANGKAVKTVYALPVWFR